MRRFLDSIGDQVYIFLVNLCKAYRFRLKAKGRLRQLLAQFAGCRRYVWNRAVELQKECLELGFPMLGYAQLCQQLCLWKKEAPFLRESHSQPLQQALKDLDLAVAAYRKGQRNFPRFKKKHIRDSFRYPQGIKVEDKRIYLPKIGWVAYRKSRSIEGQIKNVTVIRQGKHWEISIQVELSIPGPVHPSTHSVGIDLSIVRFATLSDGVMYRPLVLDRHIRKLRCEQRKLSRKTKGSENWKKQRLKLALAHQKVANVRRDYLHKVSTEISKNHAHLFVEDLEVVRMSKKGVGKRALNRKILAQGWREFLRQLGYKQEWRGGTCTAVNPRYTSQTCPQCGHISVENRPTQQDFCCVNCQFEENADLVAACNILAVGHTAAACGTSQDSCEAMKQESPRL